MKKELAVGIFFFIAMGILAHYTIIMTGDLFRDEEIYHLTVTFDNVEGLSLKAKVKVNGVIAGSVQDILLNEIDNSITLKMKMFKKFTMFKNYNIVIRSETALGGRYVSIDPGKKLVDELEFPELSDFSGLKGKTYGDPLNLLSELISENRDNFYNTIKNIRSITEKIDRGQGTIGKLINESKMHENADGLIKELRDAMEDAREQAPVTSFIRAALTAF